jgi:hypothetical protein
LYVKHRGGVRRQIYEQEYDGAVMPGKGVLKSFVFILRLMFAPGFQLLNLSGIGKCASFIIINRVKIIISVWFLRKNILKILGEASFLRRNGMKIRGDA